MRKKAFIIGAGFSSIATACYLAKAGYDVEIFEKNNHLGGRAGKLVLDGYTFDTGPTFYWMPDVFERFFKDFNKNPAEYYTLERLDPGYKVYFGEGDSVDVSANVDQIYELFESEDKGSGKRLKSFLDKAAYNYEVAIKDLVYRPGLSPLELITPQTVTKLGQFISTIAAGARTVSKNPRLISLLEFPVLFLGAKPSNTPLFYNFMNHADLILGTWYPKGGMYAVVEGLVKLAKELGVVMHTKQAVEKILITDDKAIGLQIEGKPYFADVIISGADYSHSETLLPESLRSYSEKYWNSKTFAPSALLFYLGIDKKLKNIAHHTLFFDVDFAEHASAIYDQPEWPDQPLFYASFQSLTDASVSPEGHEAAIFLIPLAPGLTDSDELREKCYDKVIARFEKLTGQEIRNNIVQKSLFGINDFVSTYNSFKGNAYGLANTLMQTAFLRPKLKSKKVENLYFTGQLTVPGPGVPPALISGKLVSELIIAKTKTNEALKTSTI